MTNYLNELFNKKEHLMQQIGRIDDLIKHEIDASGSGHQGAAEHGSGSSSSMGSNGASAQPAAPAAPAGNPAYDKLSWKKKLLHHMGKADGRGMSTSELVKELKAHHHGEWKSPSIPTLLYHMDKDGSIKIDRSAGRNLHYLSDKAPANLGSSEQKSQAQPQGTENANAEL